MTGDYFLGEGEYTIRDSVVKNTALNIKRSRNHNKITEIQNFVYSLEHNTSNKRAEFRRRLPSEIILSGYSTGCTDDALVFCTLSRELGIPSKYVETVNKNWLKSPDSRPKVHVFTDIFLRNQWVEYDPQFGYVSYKRTSELNEKYIFCSTSYLEIGKGLDFSSINVTSFGEHFRLQTLEDISFLLQRMNLVK